MKISYSWLQTLINLAGETPETVAERLTNSGLEVEAIEYKERVKGNLQGVVVGKVLQVEPHPNADKLKVCQVNVGKPDSLNIVCGAANVAVGQMVCVALIGTTLYPITGEPIKLKKSKIRGIESEGMICAEDELGLGENHDGILVLESGQFAPGTPAAVALNVESEAILHIGLTPNRTDAMSHFGVARELGVLLDKKAILPAIDAFPLCKQTRPITIDIQAPDLCPRYSGIIIQGIRVEPSPEWIQQRLSSIGLRPINNIVDVTNFVLHECGQPLHAFDLDKINGKKIVVRKAGNPSVFTTLDGKTQTLTANDLMICDEDLPLCIAGVMGGANSAVSETTTNIFIESAYFTPGTIRQTSGRLGIFSDSAYRFARGTDPNLTLYALQRATNLIQEICHGEVSCLIDLAQQDFLPRTVSFSYEKAQRLIGYNIPLEDINRILKALEIVIQPTDDPDKVILHIPTYRNDVTRFQDVIEEIVRIYGLNNIPEAQQSLVTLLSPKPTFFKFEERLAERLCGAGWTQIMTNSLTKKSFVDTNLAIPMLNPLSEETAVLRTSLLYSGLEVICFNLNRKQSNLQLFEVGKRYVKANGSYQEQTRLGLWLCGQTAPEQWLKKNEAFSFYHLKGIIKLIALWIGFEPLFKSLTDNHPELISGQIAVADKNQIWATFGQVHPSITALQDFDLQEPVFYADIDAEWLFNKNLKQKVHYTEPTKYPIVRRDISMYVESNVLYEQLHQAILSASPKLIKQINPFDVYVAKDKPKSYAISVMLSDPERTLTDTDVEKVIEKIHQKLAEVRGVTLRI